MGKSPITSDTTPTAKALLPTFDGIVGKLRFEAVTDPREVGRLILNTWNNGAGFDHTQGVQP